MRIKAIALTIILLSAAMATQANPEVKDKKVWMENVEQSLPQLLCQEDKYFRQCFKTDAKECQEFTLLLVQACLNNASLSLPAALNAEQGEYWGQMIGRCTYDLYSKFMKSKKLDSRECKQ